VEVQEDKFINIKIKNYNMENTTQNNYFKKHLWWIIPFGIFMVLILTSISYYNNFVQLEQNVDSKFSEVQNQYQRQADLIPNLVSVVSSAVSSETKFMTDVIKARTDYNNAQNEFEKDKTGIEMNNQIAFFMKSISEQYPQFKASKDYTMLSDELSGTQNRITVARGNYIQEVKNYNIATKKFPAVIFANIYGFENKDYYKAEEGATTTQQIGNGKLP